MRFVNYCIPFLFTICTVSQLFWNRVCSLSLFLSMIQIYIYIYFTLNAVAASSNSWLSDVLREHRTKLRAAERKWCKSKHPSDLSKYHSLLSSFPAEVHTAKSSYLHNKINSAPDTHNLFRTFNSLICPPSTTSHHFYNS